MSTPVRAALILLLVGVAALPYTRLTLNTDRRGTPIRRDPSAPVEFLVQSIVAPGLRNAEGGPVISGRSDPLAALRAALEQWDRPEVSSLRFAPLGMTELSIDPFDGVNVIVFEDSPAARAVTAGALAVTRISTEADGTITDTDIVFSPEVVINNIKVPFSTEPQHNTYDLQAVMTHQLGRALGAGPSSVIGGTMYEFRDTIHTFPRYLSPDELAFLADTYPAPGVAESLGALVGTITVEGDPATGVFVTAIDPKTGYIQSTLTNLDDGSYRMALPVAQYFVYAEALDGGLTPLQIQLINLDRFNTMIRPRFFGTNDSPRLVNVSSVLTRRADINVEPGRNLLIIEQVGVDGPGQAGTPDTLTMGPIRVTAGQASDIVLIGLGIDATVGIDDIRILAPGVRIRDGSVRVDPEFTFRGGPVLRATIDVEPRDRRQLGSIVVLKDRAADVYTGAFVIEPGGPRFSLEGIGNAASFAAECVAPGEIVSIFGTALGPQDQVGNAGFDAETGRIATELGGVVVTFDGIPASMFFSHSGQLNLLVPFEVAGRVSTVVIVSFGGHSSQPVTVPVVAAKPGLFGIGTQAIAVQGRGTLNGPDNPAFEGAFLTFYGTGQGRVSPGIASGAPAGSTPLSLIDEIRIIIGGVEIPSENILFAGMTPGFAGLFQLNVKIPPGLPLGDAVEIVVMIRGVASVPVTIAIQAGA